MPGELHFVHSFHVILLHRALLPTAVKRPGPATDFVAVLAVDHRFAPQAKCQGSMMTERKGTTSQAEDTAPIVTCAKHGDSKVPQQGIAVTDHWLGDCGGSLWQTCKL